MSNEYEALSVSIIIIQREDRPKLEDSFDKYAPLLRLQGQPSMIQHCNVREYR
jgi:hypothetical protein